MTEPLEDYLDEFLEAGFHAPEPSPSAPVEPGGTLGRFTIVGFVGRGAVGDVYRVHDSELDRDVAIKVLRACHLGDSRMLDRFREEAKLCGRLTHPGVVPVHEIGVLYDGRPYFAMKLIEGRTFAAILRQRAESPSGLREAVETLRRAAEAIAFAHDQGVTHGDIKPHNIMVGEFGEVQVMDWGFAIESGGSETSRGSGTPAYMAPEQATGGSRDARTDVFGLGAVLFEVLTEEPPYSGESPVDVVAAAANARPEDVAARLRAAGADEFLSAIVQRCMSPDPKDRCRDAGEFAALLDDYLGKLEQRARSLEIEVAASEASLAQARRARRYAYGWMASIVLGVSLLAGGFLWNSNAVAARRADVANAVQRAVAEASRLQERGRLTSGLATYKEALAAAVRAEQLASTPDGNAAARDGAHRLVEALRREIRVLEKRAELVRAVEAIVPHFSHANESKAVDDAFTRAFERAGVRACVPPDPESVTRLAELAGPSAIVIALDEWAVVRRYHAVPNKDAWRAPMQLAEQLDKDPWRGRVRAAFAAKDAATLKKIASDPNTLSRSARSLDYLGACLIASGASEEAKAHYRRAHAAHRGSLRICHNLAVQLDYRDPEELQEAVRLLSMALARQPEDAHLLTDLSVARLMQPDPEKGRDLAREALELDPDEPRALAMLALAHKQLGVPGWEALLEKSARLGHGRAALVLAQASRAVGRMEQAERSYRRVLELSPNDVGSLAGLGEVLTTVRRYSEGATFLERASRLAPKSAPILVDLARAYIGAGRFDALVRVLEQAEALGSKQPKVVAEIRWNRALARENPGRRKRLERILASKRFPKRLRRRRVVDTLDLALLARSLGRHRDTLRLLEFVFDNGFALGNVSILDAAASSALAVAQDADADECARCRERARQWYGGALAMLECALRGGEMSVPETRLAVYAIRYNERLRALAAGSDALPAWRELWSETDRLLEVADREWGR